MAKNKMGFEDFLKDTKPKKQKKSRAADSVDSNVEAIAEMRNGLLPGVFTAAQLGGVQSMRKQQNDDMKTQNKRGAPKDSSRDNSKELPARETKMSLSRWLTHRVRAEDEEDVEDDLQNKIQALVDDGITDIDDIADELDLDPSEVAPYLDDEDEFKDSDDFEDENDDAYDDDNDDLSSGIDDEDEYEEYEDLGDEEEDYDDYDDDALDGDDPDNDEDDDEDDLYDEEDDDFEELDFEKDDRKEHDLDREFRHDDDYDEDEFDDEDEEQTSSEYEEEDDNDFEETAIKMVNSIGDDVIDDLDDKTGTVTKWWREQVVNSPEEDTETEEDYEEEQEESGPPKIDRARLVFQQMIQQPDSTRSDIIDAFVRDIGATQSTAVSYYERLAKEAGLTGEDGLDNAPGRAPRAPAHDAPAAQNFDHAFSQAVEQEDDDDEPKDVVEVDPDGDPNKQGVIRTVDDAHLVYKRQADDGSFNELWVYNIGTGVDDELTIRRAILSGTDIPQNRTESEDGSEAYSLTTLGNAQILYITGLSN